MNSGIYFEIPQMVTNTLWSFLRNIQIENYNWYNINNQSEIYNEKSDGEFFCKKHYSGTEFFNLIQLNHHIIFLKLQAYLIDNRFKNIDSYEEFINSDCQIIILVYDCKYVEIYSKQELELYEIYQSAQENNYKNISYITENNRDRNNMNVL